MDNNIKQIKVEGVLLIHGNHHYLSNCVHVCGICGCCQNDVASKHEVQIIPSLFMLFFSVLLPTGLLSSAQLSSLQLSISPSSKFHNIKQTAQIEMLSLHASSPPSLTFLHSTTQLKAGQSPCRFILLASLIFRSLQWGGVGYVYVHKVRLVLIFLVLLQVYMQYLAPFCLEEM